MSDHERWRFDERSQVGVDYARSEEAENYDARHGRFRDVERENDAILDALQLQPEHSLIDIGAGTGSLAVQAARRCRNVYAVDVSPAMLARARQKAEAAGIRNIEFRDGGFLTYRHAAEPADAVVSCIALHHLPDFWKDFALRRIHDMLKPGGRFYLADVIFEDRDVMANAQKWIDGLATAGGDRLRDDAERHLREEFSTFDWIMEGLLARAGYRIERKNFQDGVVGSYLCEKT
jgi:putative AdoMet-dependent methyltransferase